MDKFIELLGKRQQNLNENWREMMISGLEACAKIVEIEEIKQEFQEFIKEYENEKR